MTEWTPLWLPTLLLWVAVPLVFVDAGPAFRLLAVIRWSADPVLVLFLGGFSLAVAAERWGIATPIGSGPNGIAIAAIERSHRITFVDWMAFGTPLAIGLVLAVLLYARVRFGAAQRQPAIRHWQ